MSRRRRSNNNNYLDNLRPARRRRRNPEYVKLRVYSSNYEYPISENRFVVFPMKLVPTEKMVKLGERFLPMFISTLTAHIFIYPRGVIFKEGNEYFLKISSADLENTPREQTDLENWDGLPQDSEGSIKIKINMENGALDNIDDHYMADGPWKFYSFEPIGVDSVPGESAAGLPIPTDRRELQSAEETLREYRRERERIREMLARYEQERGDTFPGNSGANRFLVGHPIGGKRRRKKRTKKKSRKKKRKTLKKKRKRRNKKRKTRR